MSPPVQNNINIPQYNTTGTQSGTTSVSTPTGGAAEALTDVFQEFASLLSHQSGGQAGQGSSLMPQGQQGNQGLTNSLALALVEFAVALAEHIGQPSGSSSTAGSNNAGSSSGGTTGANEGTSQTNPTGGGGNGSVTSPKFSLNLAPSTSAAASDFTQAGQNTINNMPASTLANVDINAYTGDAMRAMKDAGYSQDQIKNYMTGLYQAYNARTMPASTSGNTGGPGAGSGGNNRQSNNNNLLQQRSQQSPLRTT